MRKESHLRLLTLDKRKRLTWSQKKSKNDVIQVRGDADSDDKEACCGTRLLWENEADEEDICLKHSVILGW